MKDNSKPDPPAPRRVPTLIRAGLRSLVLVDNARLNSRLELGGGRNEREGQSIGWTF